jgi:cell wall-associated NlpC family hydrolase
VVLCCATALILAAAAPAAPAFADPPEISVPDDGARPEGDPGTVGGDPLPSPGDTPVSGPGVSRGPYANRIAEQARDLATLGESTTAAEEEADTRKDQATAAYQYWLDLNSEAEELAALAADMAAENYQETAAEVQGVTDEFDKLFNVNPDLLDYDELAVQSEADSAADDADIAKATLDAAQAAQSIAENAHEELADQLDEDTKALEDLIEDNAEAIAVEDAKAEADNQANYQLGDIGADVDGWRAADKAQRAVEYAVGQTGKPYEWGAEGPDTFDCSGLMQTAYAEQGVSIPRVANDQYRATSQLAVDIAQMLPGDLIFYGDVAGDWTSVYHVGMYIGDGQMVHAPRPGDVVKVAPVWFNDFFGAHRVVEAVQTDPDAGDKNKDDGSNGTKQAEEPQDQPATRPDPPAEPGTGDTSPSGDGGDTPAPTPTPTPTG